MSKKLYPYRFEIFLASQTAILFGGLLFPEALFEQYISPFLFILNLLAGILLLSKSKRTMWFVIILLAIALFSFGIDISSLKNQDLFSFLHLGTFFLFYIILTVELVKQVWTAQVVGKNVIFGLISGYITLGLIGYFICMGIDLSDPLAYKGLEYTVDNPQARSQGLLYYSYITLMTIGYGEIVPVTDVSRMAAILIGLLGQFYLVVLTAIIVGKFINQRSFPSEK